MAQLPYFIWEETLPYITTDPRNTYRTVCQAWRRIFNRHQEVRLCVGDEECSLGDATTLEASGSKLFQHPQLIPHLSQLKRLKLKLQGESSIDYIELVQVLKNLTRLKQLALDFSGCRYRLSPLLASTNRVSELSLVLLDFEPERVQEALDGLNHPRLTSLSLTIPTLNQTCLNHLLTKLSGLKTLSLLWKDNASGNPVQLDLPANSQLQQLSLERFYASESRTPVLTITSLATLTSLSCRTPFKLRTPLRMPHLQRLAIPATALAQNRPFHSFFPNLTRLDVNCRKVDTQLVELLLHLPQLRRLRLSHFNDPKLLLALLSNPLPVTHLGLACPRGYPSDLMDSLSVIFPSLFYLHLDSYLPLPSAPSTPPPYTTTITTSTSHSTTTKPSNSIDPSQSSPNSNPSQSSTTTTTSTTTSQLDNTDGARDKLSSILNFSHLTILYLSLDRATFPSDLVAFLRRSPNLDRLLLSGNVDHQVLDHVRLHTPRVRIEPMPFLTGSCQSQSYLTTMF